MAQIIQAVQTPLPEVNLVQRHNHAQALNLLVIVLPGAYDALDRIVQPLAPIFPQDQNGNAVPFACLVDRHLVPNLPNEKCGHPFFWMPAF